MDTEKKGDQYDFRKRSLELFLEIIRSAPNALESGQSISKFTHDVIEGTKKVSDYLYNGRSD
jgi:hypothetical protein